MASITPDVYGASKPFDVGYSHPGCTGHDCTFANRTPEHLLHHIKVGIPTKLTPADIAILPSRKDFLDQQMCRVYDAMMARGLPLMFLPTDDRDKTEKINDKYASRVYLYGVLPCGYKVCVILDNIDICVEVAVPRGRSTQAFKDTLKSTLSGASIRYSGVSVVKKYGLHGFDPCPRDRIKLSFVSLYDRKNALKYFNGENNAAINAGRPTPYEITSDDDGFDRYYFRKIAREQKFSTADWNKITDYTIMPPGSTSAKNVDATIMVDVSGFNALSAEERTRFRDPAHSLSKVIDKDLTTIMQWDIETYSEVQNGVVPTEESTDCDVFMICSKYFMHWSRESNISVCCVDINTAPRPGMNLIIECPDEASILRTHAEMMSRMRPELTSAFNGGCFDWPIVRGALRRAKLGKWFVDKISGMYLQTAGNYPDTEMTVFRNYWKSESVKIDAENNHDLKAILNVPGILDIDVLPIFLKLYPRAEVRKAASLNWFLARNRLPSKEDMPYKRMFRIVERARALNDAPHTCHCEDLATGKLSCVVCTHVDPFVDGDPLEDCPGDRVVDYGPSVHPEGQCCACGKRQRCAELMGDVAKYCDIDCQRPQDLCVVRLIVPEKRELASMSYTSMFDAFYRADGMKVCNFVGAYCHENNIAYSNANLSKPDHDKDHYPGAYVVPPNGGEHSDRDVWVRIVEKLLSDAPNPIINWKTQRGRPITGLDFASLYPSLMMAYNLSPDKVVKTPERAAELVAQGYTLHKIAPFNYEKGAKKGESVNKHLTAEGWTVRHNSVHTAADTNIVDKYVKITTETFADGSVHETRSLAVADGVGYKLVPEDTKSAEHSSPPAESAPDTRKPVKRTVVYEAVRGRTALPGERMGAFPAIVKGLFDMRVPVKREFVRLEKLIEQLEAAGEHAVEANTPNAQPADVGKTIPELKFDKDKVDAKQKALKVLANTFYGKSGDFRSPLYELLVAAGITTAGQMNIKAVKAFVESRGFTTHYGDTDSLYISCPDELFAEVDALYEASISEIDTEYAGVERFRGLIKDIPADADPRVIAYKRARVDARVAWWTAQVKITMDVMGRLKEDVSDFLLATNGTRFLNMAYEEVGFPTHMCGKKKYFLTPHVETINFYPDVGGLFVKGIDIIKQGQAAITKQMGYKYMMEVLSPENERGSIELAEELIRDFYNTPPESVELFTLAARYRPHKKNVPVQTFYKRMVAESAKWKDTDPVRYALFEPPEPGDKFEYIIAKKVAGYNIRGCQIELKKGDLKEYVRVWKASQGGPQPVEIDLDYYMRNQIIGIFARFVAHDRKFVADSSKYDLTTKEGFRAYDIECVKNATNYFEAVCDQVIGAETKAERGARGRKYQAAFREANKIIRGNFREKYNGADLLFDVVVDKEGGARSTALYEKLTADADARAQAAVVDAKVKRPDIGWHALKTMYIGTQRTRHDGVVPFREHRGRWCDAELDKIRREMFDVIGDVIQLSDYLDTGLSDVVYSMRTAIDSAGEIAMDMGDVDAIMGGVNPAHTAALARLNTLFARMVAIQTMKVRCAKTCALITAKCAESIGDTIEPSTAEIRRMMYAEKPRNAPVGDYEFQ